MSQEDVAAVEDAYRALAGSGLDRFIEHWSDDLDHRSIIGAPGVVFTIRGRKLARGREYATRDEALEAAGLRE